MDLCESVENSLRDLNKDSGIVVPIPVRPAPVLPLSPPRSETTHSTLSGKKRPRKTDELADRFASDPKYRKFEKKKNLIGSYRLAQRHLRESLDNALSNLENMMDLQVKASKYKLNEVIFEEIEDLSRKTEVLGKFADNLDRSIKILQKSLDNKECETCGEILLKENSFEYSQKRLCTMCITKILEDY